jgi:hypothetical protein
MKKKQKTNTVEFLENSKKVIVNKLENIEDEVERYHILSILEHLKSFKEKKKLKKIYIPKDATASVYQNLVRLLSPKNEDILKICNMGDSEN